MEKKIKFSEAFTKKIVNYNVKHTYVKHGLEFVELSNVYYIKDTDKDGDFFTAIVGGTVEIDYYPFSEYLQHREKMIKDGIWKINN